MLGTAKRSVRVVVTGMGAISPLGVGLEESWSNLIKGQCGIKELKEEGYQNLPCKIAAVIPGKEKIFSERFAASELRTMAPSTALGLIAAEEALRDSKWIPESASEKEETGVAVGVGMVDLNDICRTSEELKTRGYNRVSPYFVPRVLPNMVAGQISIKYGFQGPNHAVSTACATGAHAIGDAFRFIKNGDAKVMVCGGAESCISPLSIAGFCRLRALATKFNDAPEKSSRPFDKGRDGFVMGEGSAIIVLEELEHALERNAKIYAEVLGYGLSADAAHLTAPDGNGSGAVLAMRRAIKDADVLPEDIGYVNAHATSTPLGDNIEARAVRSVFSNHTEKVKVSSTKGSHGHLLGAAGNLESVFTLMACSMGKLPPNINLDAVDDEMNLNYVRSSEDSWCSLSRDGRRMVLKNAFGFGGTNASLCFAEFKR
ncbi:UNVERIFIED_CONTAM: hypothetical protein PYX00_005396 [Menopon gallinae]|uniref:3-oxoacyl-[acyl-carrier-protein] synthase n=1 Tax=Menopon gallinae TaxID=328185 RepID=A0AAW2HRZ6_9NEOP